MRFEVVTAFFEVSSKPDKIQAIVLPHINIDCFVFSRTGKQTPWILYVTMTNFIEKKMAKLSLKHLNKLNYQLHEKFNIPLSIFREEFCLSKQFLTLSTRAVTGTRKIRKYRIQIGFAGPNPPCQIFGSRYYNSCL